MTEIFSIDVDTLGDLKPLNQVVLSLGSNQGDSLEILQGAVDRLAETPNLMLVDVSSVYRTAPVGNTNQPDFYNIVVIADEAHRTQYGFGATLKIAQAGVAEVAVAEPGQDDAGALKDPPLDVIVRHVLAAQGPLPFRALADGTARLTEPVAPTDREVAEALQRLVWQGKATSDGLGFPRAGGLAAAASASAASGHQRRTPGSAKPATSLGDAAVATRPAVACRKARILDVVKLPTHTRSNAPWLRRVSTSGVIAPGCLMSMLNRASGRASRRAPVPAEGSRTLISGSIPASSTTRRAMAAGVGKRQGAAMASTR